MESKVKPLISITTVTYNSEETLARTIESVLNQTYKRIEYLIIDGKSTDNTLNIAESYRDAMKENGIFYYIISEQDRGMYEAMNKGIGLAHGNIIGNINSDDWYENDALEQVVSFFERTGCDLMYADLRMVRADGSTFIKRAKKTKTVNSRNWNHPTQFAKREVYEKNSYKLESIHDDFDLLLRIRKQGYHINVLNRVIANFSMEGVSHRRSISDCIERGRCRYRIYRNNGYSRWYLLECIMMETAKYILG